MFYQCFWFIRTPISRRHLVLLGSDTQRTRHHWQNTLHTFKTLTCSVCVCYTKCHTKRLKGALAVNQTISMPQPVLAEFNQSQEWTPVTPHTVRLVSSSSFRPLSWTFSNRKELTFLKTDNFPHSWFEHFIWVLIQLVLGIWRDASALHSTFQWMSTRAVAREFHVHFSTKSRLQHHLREFGSTSNHPHNRRPPTCMALWGRAVCWCQRCEQSAPWWQWGYGTARHKLQTTKTIQLYWWQFECTEIP